MTGARYRCTACGNLTRFDVTESSTTRSFHHYTVGGELVIEELELLESNISDVTCRWCGSAANVTEANVTEANVTEADGAAAPVE